MKSALEKAPVVVPVPKAPPRLDVTSACATDRTEIVTVPSPTTDEKKAGHSLFRTISYCVGVEEPTGRLRFVRISEAREPLSNAMLCASDVAEIPLGKSTAPASAASSAAAWSSDHA